MTIEIYLLYLLAVGIFFATPPDTSQLLIISNSIRHGLKRSKWTIAGDLSANCLQMTAAAFGLAAVIASSAFAFTLVKWLGVTGHGLNICEMHRRSLERFDFDSVLLPWNWAMSRNAAYAAEFADLHRSCREKDVAFQLIKAACHRPWRDGEEKTRATWYKTLEDQDDLEAALHWAMGVEGSFINTAGDVNLLPRVLDAVADFDSVPSDEEMIRTAESGNWEPLFA